MTVAYGGRRVMTKVPMLGMLTTSASSSQLIKLATVKIPLENMMNLQYLIRAAGRPGNMQANAPRAIISPTKKTVHSTSAFMLFHSSDRF